MRALRSINIATGALVALLLGLGALATGAPAQALQAPGWEMDSHSYPTNMAPGSNATVAIAVYNVGSKLATAGATMTDTLPVGVEGLSEEGWSCNSSSPMVCTRSLGAPVSGAREEYGLNVKIDPAAAEGRFVNQTEINGGGAIAGTTNTSSLTISSTPASFGFANADAWVSNADGTIDRQAGSHPYEFTFNLELNTDYTPTLHSATIPADEARNVTVNLPPGLVGNPNAVQRCTREEFDREVCPTGSQIGVAPSGLGGGHLPIVAVFPVYNMVPPRGHPAEFAFTIFNNNVFLDASVRSDGDYGITEHVNNIPQRLVVSSTVTIWGVPADPGHDAQRYCLKETANGPQRELGCSSLDGKVPFLTLPTSCTGPEKFSASINEWAEGSVFAETAFVSHDANDLPQGLSGCDRLNFGPTISVAPDTSYADTPAGLTVEVKAVQETLNNEAGIATSNIKDTTVTLPEGVVINPGQAAGLGACQMSESAVGTQEAPSCPNDSKVGTDEIETPVLAHGLKGNVYVLQSDPPNLKLLVAASGEGVNLKLVGDVHLDEATGRLTTTFSETPELPFTDFKLSFSGGAQAALATPTRCGSYLTASDFTPWSSPFVPHVFPSSEFLVSSGPRGSSCPAGGRLPFTPAMIAGSTTDQAGGFTDFSLLLTRQDDQQRIGSLQFKTPEGLSGMISKVPLCGEAQANAGTCSSDSQIGHTVVEAGPGPYPLVVPQPGQPPAPIYLTGGYKGAPYGLTIVVPLRVGPFTLQTQIVRAKIEVNPITTQLTITTDPLPTIIDGIPADLRCDRRGDR